MAVQIKTRYRKPTGSEDTAITVSADLVDFRPRSAARTQVGTDIYLKITATGATDWYRKVDGHISDALRGYKLGIDGGTSVDANNGGTPTTSLSLDGIEGVLTQLEKLAAPTVIDATATGSGGVHVEFVPSTSDPDLVLGYYFFTSADCETWTRVSGQGGTGISTGCIAKASLGDVTVGGVAKKTFDLTSITPATVYIGVTAVDSTTATTEFCESAVGSKVTAIVVS